MIMKHIIPLILATGLLGAAEIPPVNAPPASKNYLDGMSLSPFATVRHVNIGDSEQYGIGLDVGFPINKSVSLHVQSLAYSDNDWHGSTIDESAVLVKADLVKYSSERLKLYALGGGDRSWDADDWAFGVGLGINLNISKRISVGVDTRIRSWFDREEDLQTRGLVNLTF